MSCGEGGGVALDRVPSKEAAEPLALDRVSEKRSACDLPGLTVPPEGAPSPGRSRTLFSSAGEAKVVRAPNPPCFWTLKSDFCEDESRIRKGAKLYENC